MAYTTIDKPSDYFNTVIYSGSTLDGSEDMQPDWVWMKNRDDVHGHQLYDVIRGVTKRLSSNNTGTESTDSTGLTSFNSDGFTVGSEPAVNANTENIVAWNWKAGGSASSNSNGSVTTSVSANTTAGFSVVNVPTTGSVLTAGHGLTQAPEIIFEKSRDRTDNWIVYNSSIGNTKAIFLNLTNATSTATDFWNDTSPTSTVWTMGSENSVNNASQETIAYCFHSVKGYSKIGSYTGNGNADGTFVHLGFKPAMVIQKMSSSAGYSWHIFDNKRDTFNAIDKRLFPDTADTESTGTNIDFVSNGFKFRSTGTGYNGSGNTFIYMAFAESPFVNSNGIPNNAR